MADNVTANSGSGGATFRTDDDGTAHWPYVKAAYGADNTQTLVTATNGLPVQNDSANTFNVTVNAALPAGTNAIGKLAANSGVDIGDVDVTTITNMHSADYDTGAGTDTTLAVGIAVPASGGAAVIPGDATAGLKVDLGSDNDVTVTGTVDLGATDNAVLDSIAANTANLTNCIVQDDAPFTPATGYLMMIGGEYDDAAPDSVDEGDAGNVRITANRSMHTTLRDAAGNERGLNVDANGEIGVTLGNATLPDTSGGDLAALGGAVSGSEVQVDVVASLPAGTNAIGKLAANSGVDIGDVDVTSVPNGSSHYRNIDANAEDAIKGSAGILYWIHVMNMTASVAYLHLYDATTANVTPGSTTPDYTFPIPTQGDTNGAGFMIPFPGGQDFANAITLVCTTTTDGSAGDPGTNGVFVNAGYA